jgi:hypothetical protein
MKIYLKATIATSPISAHTWEKCAFFAAET